MIWLLAALGCTPATTEARCVTGRTATCTCPSGQRGAQVCTEDNQWSVCRCDGEADTGAGCDTAETADTGAAGDTGSAPPRPVQVYLLGGQSNMDGGGFVTGLPPSLQLAQDDVRLFWSGRGLWQGLSPASTWSRYGSGEYFGPEVTFGRAMQDATGDAAVAVIKHAVGGTNLADCWDPGASRADASQGSCYRDFLATVDAALAALDAEGQPYEIAGMAWMQGEADATYEPFADAYADNLTHFVSRIREDVSAPSMPFAMGRIDCRQHCPWRDAVRSAQQAVADADPLVFAVETADLPQNADGLHFDASGVRTLGARLAAALLSAPQPQTAQPAVTLAGAARSDYTGDFVVGYAFQTARVISVTDLGTLDYGWDGLSNGATVALWDASSQAVLRRVVVPAQATAGSSIWGGWRFAAIEPITLEPGTYVLGAQVYSGSADRYLHDAQISLADGVTWLEGRHSSGTGVQFPTTVSTGEASWLGPNFLFTPAD